MDLHRLVGDEKLFLDFSILEPCMFRKLLEKTPGSEIMNGTDRF